MMRFASILALGLCFWSCSPMEDYKKSPVTAQQINGRESEPRFPVYQIKMPVHWIRKDPLPGESLADTKKPLCEFYIPGGDKAIRIAIHNFPSESIGQRIPPAAQIARWKNQFDILKPEESTVIPQAYSGYLGLRFKGTGQLSNETATLDTVLGWSLQLSEEHYRTLLSPLAVPDKNLSREMRADVTIKAVGPKELMQQYEEEIIQFARSFELIEEIPLRS